MSRTGSISETADNPIWVLPTGIEYAGRLQPPVSLLKGDLEYHYLSSSTGEVHKQAAAGAQLGIFYWLQVE